MKRLSNLANLAEWDRLGRVLIGAVLLILALNGGVNGLADIVLGVLGGLLVATATVGFCPLYVPFHFRTLLKK